MFRSEEDDNLGRKSVVTLSFDEMIDKLRHKLVAASYSSTGPDLASLFDKIDLDKNGVIDIRELKTAVRKLIPYSTEKQLRELMKLADKVFYFLRTAILFTCSLIQYCIPFIGWVWKSQQRKFYKLYESPRDE